MRIHSVRAGLTGKRRPGGAGLVRFLLGMAVAAVTLGGCAPPFDSALTTQVSDDSEPTISITRPNDGSSYAAVVLVEGDVVDAVSAGDSAGQAITVSFEVLSTSIAGSTDVADDGSFSFSFETAGLSGSLTLRVTAVDWNGNVDEILLTLTNEGAIPTFTATPGNRSVTLTWEAVPETESYTVRYAGTGRVPTETGGILIEDVTSPLTIPALQNGAKYSFLLEARHSSETSSWSELVSTIPLSASSLVPRAIPGYGEIAVEWPAIEGAEEYELFRASSPDGPYTQLTGARSSTAYADRDVADDTAYYYTVRPAGQEAVLSGPGRAQTTPFPDSALDLVSSQLGVFNTGQSVAVSGNRAYVGSRGAFFGSTFADIHIVDISTLARPNQISSYRLDTDNTPGNVATFRDIEVVGSTVYLVSTLDRIYMVDASDPAALTDTVATGFTSSQAIAVEGSAAYVADLTGALRKVPADTLDLADPAADQYLLEGGASAYDVAVRNGYAFVAAGTAGLEIIDLADFSRADLVEMPFTSGGIATSVALNEGYAYLGISEGSDTFSGLAVIDVSTIGSASLSASLDLDQNAEDISVTDGRAYLSSGTGGLSVVDVTDPAAPILVTTNAVSEESVHSSVVGNYLLNAGSQGALFSAFQVNPYPQPVAGTTLATGVGALVSVQNGVAVAGDNTAGDRKVNFLDVSDGGLIDSVPIPSGYTISSEIPGIARGHGNYVFYTIVNNASSTSRIEAVRVESATGVSTVGGLDLKALGGPVRARGDYAYVGSYNSLLVIDIADPSAMQIVGFETVPDLLQGLAWGPNGLIGLAVDPLDSTAQLVSFDLSQPTSPVVTDTLALPDRGNWVGVAGDTALVALGSTLSTEDLLFVDIGDPADLSQIGSPYDLSGDEMLFGAIQGEYLYAVSSGEINVVDFSEPLAPVTVTLWAANPSSAPVISGDRALFTAGGNLLRARLRTP